ncbi:GNAT family N-acetyltransferase [Kribbella sp. ALI-6-A]|uniref:GNAT family N-acetyltransferase n=1 Tax=Kribbella sp. ALI-6-A TaxID=1933817 RepID=UPI00097C23BD|nr:GNAT family N-acetyltransferase [Kribbella sp. ALI-6-A]ONI69978.1 GNAT family N-acetyltransferase [Kribbella sp. ALI-6-A]
MPIRLAVPGDLPVLRAIEKAAGDLFRQIGMVDIAEHDPPALHVLRSYQRAGRAWVAADTDDQPVGFVLVKVVDGAAHIEQISVHPDHQRQGLGRALIDAVDAWAVDQGLPALTLSTFRDVAWNAPYYAGLGFRPLDDEDLTPGLLEIRAEETAIGLAPADRLFMRRPTR